MGGCTQSVEAKNATLKLQNESLKIKITTIEAVNKKLKEKNAENTDLEELIKTNKTLKTENAQMQNLNKQNEELKTKLAVITKQHTEVTKQYEQIHLAKESPALSETMWRPLTQLVEKFNEFDLSGSGYVDRTEFHKLCVRIESELKIARLFSSQHQHSSSSLYGNSQTFADGTIDSKVGWIAATNNKQQWYQIDAVITVCVAGIVIQGRQNSDQWVKSFHISYSNDGVNWTKLDRDQLFHGSKDRESKNRVMFDEPILARFIRLQPISWHKHISLRLDLLWVENFAALIDDALQPRKSEFTFQEQDQLFDLFDLKNNGGVSIEEFLAVLDRETIRNPRNHPHEIIKQTMKYLLNGNIDVAMNYNVNMLASKVKRCKNEKISKDIICSVCYFEPGIYGMNAKCDHRLCFECLQDSIKYIMENGKFPAYCIGCSAEQSMKKEARIDFDILIDGGLLRFWVEENVIDMKMAIRFDHQQKRFIQTLSDAELSKCETFKKCRHCEYVGRIVENEPFECQKCFERSEREITL